MASVFQEPNGRRRVDFVGLDRKRRSIRLGEVSDRKARLFASRVETLLQAAGLGQPLDAQTAQWIADLPDTGYQKLVQAGLVNPREKLEVAKTLLGPFLLSYLKRRNDLKPVTLLVVGHVVRNLRDYFGDNRDIATINPAECDDFARWLATGARSRGKADKAVKGLSPATIGKRIQWCCAFFRDAVRRKLIDSNPFAEVKQSKATNPERQRYVPAATIEQIIEFTPDAEWKCLLAMSRYLGLRVPSEPFSLTWDHVDWARSRLKVPSPKTEVHGKPFRWVPILPEVKPHLDRLFEEAAEGATYVFARLRERGSVQAAERGFWGNMNLRQQFMELIEKAGFSVWPKLFHNLRASAQTDLTERFALHVVCDWLGNTQAVAASHYLQTTDAHFEAAIRGSENPQQNPQQGVPQTAEIAASGPTRKTENPCFSGVSEKINSGGGTRTHDTRLMKPLL